MSAYNAEKFIQKAIESMLNQTFSDFEFIIIDDCSTDQTFNIIESFSDFRIKIIRNYQNLGLAASLNKGIEIAQGKYIARMDADDISLPERLEIQYNYLEQNEEIAILDTKIELIDEFDTPISTKPTSNKHFSSKEIKERLPKANCLNHPTVMIRSLVLNQVKYTETAKTAQDYILWLQLSSLDYKFVKTNQVLLKYRISKTGITQTTNGLPVLAIQKTSKAQKLFLKWAFKKKLINRFVINVLLVFILYRLITLFNFLFPQALQWYAKNREKLPKFLQFRF